MDRVLIIGASCRAVAQSARAAGFEVIAFDLFIDRDLQSIADCKHLTQFPASAVQLAKQFASTPIVLAGGMENYPEIVAQLGLRHPLLGATPNQLDSLRDLKNLMQWSSICDIAFPDTILGRWPLNGSYVWKPYGSAGGRGIRDLIMTDENYIQPEDASWPQGYIQKRIDGIPIGVVMIGSFADVEIFGISRSLTSNDWPGPSRYIYRGSIAPYVLPANIEAKIRALGALVRDRFDFRGVLGADFIWQPSSQTLWLLELNPRWTASIELHEWSKERNLFQEHVHACQRQVPSVQAVQVNVLKPPFARKPVYGKAIVYSTRGFQVSDKHSDRLFEKAREAANVASDCYFADIPMAGVEIQTGSPVLSILASGDCPDSVARTLKSAREQVLALLEVDT